MIRTLPKDSSLCKALTAIFEAKHVLMVDQNDHPINATVDQFVSVMIGGPGPKDAHGVIVTPTGLAEARRLMRREYNHYRQMVGNVHLSMAEFQQRRMSQLTNDGVAPALKILVTLKSHEVAADDLLEKLLEPNPQDPVQ